MKRRWILICASLGLLIAAIIFVSLVGTQRILALTPPCLSMKWFGLPCPGCGSTRAVVALLQGRFADAWRYNALLFLLPGLIAAWIWLPLSSRAKKVFWGCLLGFIILFTIARLVGWWPAP